MCIHITCIYRLRNNINNVIICVFCLIVVVVHKSKIWALELGRLKCYCGVDRHRAKTCGCLEYGLNSEMSQMRLG